MTVSTTIKSIQDIMRQDAGVDGDAQRISQLVWLIFLKIFDDSERELRIRTRLRLAHPRDACAGATGPPTMRASPARSCWTSSTTSSSPRSRIWPSARAATRAAAIVREVFADSYNYMKSGTLIRQVINKLNEIDFSRQEDRHLFNDIYEKILRDLQSAGNAGEYYTPRAGDPVYGRYDRPAAGRHGARPGLRHRRLSGLRPGAMRER